MGTGTQHILRRGFTIIELIIVIVVIGVLATIVTVAYNGITQNAKDSSVLSDAEVLDGLETQYGLQNDTSGKAWYSGDGIDPDLNFTPSEDNIVDIVINTDDYCIRVYNPEANQFNTLSSSAVVESTSGICGALIPSSDAIIAAGEDPGDWTAAVSTVSNLAGTPGVPGSTDGTGVNARFDDILGIAVGPTGDIYVADQGANVIRKVTPAGVVTTIAGSGAYGLVDGNGTSAQFDEPSGIAIDSLGNMYIADSDNSAIRKITPSLDVTTLAGGTYGFVDGTGNAARFKWPTGIAIDPVTSDLYVADASNDSIRKVTQAGVVTTVAGNGSGGFLDGTGSAARFEWNYAIVMGPDGVLYVSDGGNGSIRKVTTAGVVTTFVGNGTQGFVNGTGSAARFEWNSGLAFDDNGDLYVSDWGNNVIRKVTPAGVVTTFAGTGSAGLVNGYRTAARFNTPDSIAIGQDGVMYITDESNYVIRKIE